MIPHHFTCTSTLPVNTDDRIVAEFSLVLIFSKYGLLFVPAGRVVYIRRVKVMYATMNIERQPHYRYYY